MNNCLLMHVVKTLQVFPQAIGLDGDIQLGTTHPSLTASWPGLYLVSPDAGPTEWTNEPIACLIEINYRSVNLTSCVCSYTRCRGELLMVVSQLCISIIKSRWAPHILGGLYSLQCLAEVYTPPLFGYGTIHNWLGVPIFSHNIHVHTSNYEWLHIFSENNITFLQLLNRCGSPLKQL